MKSAMIVIAAISLVFIDRNLHPRHSSLDIR